MPVDKKNPNKNGQTLTAWNLAKFSTISTNCCYCKLMGAFWLSRQWLCNFIQMKNSRQKLTDAIINMRLQELQSSEFCLSPPHYLSHCQSRSIIVSHLWNSERVSLYKLELYSSLRCKNSIAFSEKTSLLSSNHLV